MMYFSLLALATTLMLFLEDFSLRGEHFFFVKSYGLPHPLLLSQVHSVSPSFLINTLITSFCWTP